MAGDIPAARRRCGQKPLRLLPVGIAFVVELTFGTVNATSLRPDLAIQGRACGNGVVSTCATWARRTPWQVRRVMIRDVPAELCALTLVMKNVARSRQIEQACLAAGFRVQAVSSIAELERWPAGQIVLTDAAYVTPFWTYMGAVEVVAFVDESEGQDALKCGATRWMPTASEPDGVAAALRCLGLGHQAPAVRPSD